MESVNGMRTLGINDTCSKKFLAQNGTLKQEGRQISQSDIKLTSSHAGQQVELPLTHRDPSEIPPRLSHPRSLEKSKDLGHNEYFVPNDSLNFIYHSKQHVMPSHSQGRDLIHPWQQKKDISSHEDRPILIGLSIPVKGTESGILSPQTALSSSVESPVVNNKNSTLHRYPRSQRNDDTSSISTIRYPEMSKPPQVDETSKTSEPTETFSILDSSNSSSWIDDLPYSSTRSRTVSFCTTFEEDESPILPIVQESALYLEEIANQQLKIDTVAAQRSSRGWWNYILSPFLSASSSPLVEEEYDKGSFPEVTTIKSGGITGIRNNKKYWDGEILSASKSPKNSKSQIELYLDTKVKSVTSSTPQVQGARLGLCITPFEASICASSELESNHTRSHFGFDQKDNLCKERPPDVLENNHLFQSGNTEKMTVGAIHGNFSLNNPQQQSVRANQQQLKKKILSDGIFQKTGNKLSPALYVPPLNSHYTQKKGSKLTRKSSNSPISQRRNILSSKLPNLQSSTMSSRPGMLIPEVHLIPPSRKVTEPIHGYLETPAISNGGNYSEKYLREINVGSLNKKERLQKKDFNNRTSRYLRFRGDVSNFVSCFQSRANNKKRRKRQKQYVTLIIFLLFLIFTTLLVTLSHVRPKKKNLQSHVEPKVSDIQSQWLNLTEFPPIFLGFSTIITPVLTKENSACVTPSTEWSCHLPKELQSTIKGGLSNQPDLFLQIDWDNSTDANATSFKFNSNRTNFYDIFRRKVSIKQPLRYPVASVPQAIKYTPDPVPPTNAEEWFLGSTTDGIVSADKAGEPTPFYISFLKSANPTVVKFTTASKENRFPNVSSIIPPPNLRPDGTAAPANLLPFVTYQPLKLYDRDLPTEHFGFYSYFDRSIFLKSIDPHNINDSRSRPIFEDLNGGAVRTEASYRCTWSQTRFLVQIWTRKNANTQLNRICNPKNGSDAIVVCQQSGSFPYPITITLDRHGGDPRIKTLYCYKFNEVGGLDVDSGHIITEFRKSGGVLINPAPTIFANKSDSNMGGFDGGSSGCLCQWSNFQENPVR